MEFFVLEATATATAVSFPTSRLFEPFRGRFFFSFGRKELLGQFFDYHDDDDGRSSINELIRVSAFFVKINTSYHR